MCGCFAWESIDVVNNKKISEVGLRLTKSTEPPGQMPLVVNVVVVGSFEEGEQKISTASNVVMV